MSELDELLDHYFSLGVAEGKEGRDHDTPTGEAQATRDLIMLKIERLRALTSPSYTSMGGDRRTYPANHVRRRHFNGSYHDMPRDLQRTADTPQRCLERDLHESRSRGRGCLAWRQAFGAQQVKNAQQAGMLCNEPLFWAFLKSRQVVIDRAALVVKGLNEAWPFLRSKEDAAAAVRFIFDIDSRRELDDPDTNLAWREFVADFELWKRGIE